MILKRDQILAADDLRREVVPVPEWGGDVIVSAMTGSARDAWEASIVTKDGKANLADIRAKLAAACIVDESGALLFTPADIPALSAKSSAALDRVVKMSQTLNRIGDKELEDLKGN